MVSIHPPPCRRLMSKAGNLPLAPVDHRGELHEERRDRHGQPPVEIRRDIPVRAVLPRGLEQVAARLSEARRCIDIDPELAGDVDGLHLSAFGERLDPMPEGVSAQPHRVLERVKERGGR